MTQQTPQLIDDEPVEQRPDVIPIQDIDQFAQILSAWHGERIGQIKRLLEVPEGTVFECGEESIELSGPALAGFKFGLEMALMQVGELPFAAELEDAPA